MGERGGQREKEREKVSECYSMFVPLAIRLNALPSVEVKSGEKGF